MPGLRTVSGKPILIPVPVRTNLSANPTGAGSASATKYDTWYTSYATSTPIPTVTTLSGLTDGPIPGITNALRVQTAVSAQDVGSSQRGFPAGSGMPIVAGDVVSAAIWIRPTVDAVTITLSLAWKKDPAQASNTGTAYGPATLCPVNVWTRVPLTGAVAPALTTTAWLYVQARGVQATAHDWQQTGALVEKTATVGTYFDGSTAADATTAYGWSGAANVSPAESYTKRVLRWLDIDGVTWRTLTEFPQRTNLCTNPSMEAGTTSGWGTNGCTASAAQEQARYGTWAIKCVVNSSTIAALGPYVTTANAAVAAGDAIAGSLWLYSATAYTAISSLEFKDATGARVGLTGGPATAIPANTWTRVTVTGTAPTGTDRVTLTGYSNTVLPLNTVIYGDGALIEKSATIGTYFDGSTSRSNAATNPSVKLSDDGWGRRWFGGGSGTGTYSRVAPAAGGSAVAGGGYERKTWTVAPPQNGDTGFEIMVRSNASGTPANYFTCTPGEVITVSGFLRSSAPGKGFEVGVYWFPAGSGTMLSRVHGTTKVDAIPNTWQRISGTFTAPAGAGCFYVILDVYGRGSADTLWKPGDTLDGTGVLIERSASVGSYFEGTTNDDGDYRYLWSSTANASTSIALP